MGIQKKMMLSISAILLIPFVLLTFLISRGISQNSSSLVNKILENIATDNQNSDKLLATGFDDISSALQTADKNSGVLIAGLYDKSFNTIVKAAANKIFPLISEFDFDGANEIVTKLLEDNSEIVYVRYVTSESPAESDIQTFGQKISDENHKVFSHEIKDEMSFFSMEVQFNLAGMTILADIKKNFDSINKNNNQLIELLRKNEATSLEQARNFTNSYVKEGINKLILKISITIIGILILVCVLIFYITRSITKPIEQAVEIAKKISTGDLRCHLGIDRKDEIGAMATALNNIVSGLSGMVKNIDNGVMTITSASKELDIISADLSSGSAKIKNQSATTSATSQQSADIINSVTETATKMSVQAGSIASASDEMSGNVQSVALTIEEMTASIQEVSQNCAKAQALTSQALQNTLDSNKKIDELALVAQNIGKVIDVIGEITEQTKLLALNATIEAARAGEAGKGFAVVADEVKDLAKQTAKATSDIAIQIQEIQLKTSEVVGSIKNISAANTDVNDITTVISAAVEEQTSTAGGIMDTVGEATRKAAEVSENIKKLSTNIDQEVVGNMTQAAEGINEIATNIVSINTIAGETDSKASDTKDTAAEMSGLAAQLQEQMAKFKIAVT